MGHKLPFHALVARPVRKKERDQNPQREQLCRPSGLVFVPSERGTNLSSENGKMWLVKPSRTKWNVTSVTCWGCVLRKGLSSLPVTKIGSSKDVSYIRETEW
jgi:hypothetical protein